MQTVTCLRSPRQSPFAYEVVKSLRSGLMAKTIDRPVGPALVPCRPAHALTLETRPRPRT